jgi:asparagine N-glycosylation enzyme membrane subunit Stt3
VSGWSFVGPTGQADSTPTALYASAADVWGWDEVTQNWVYYSPDPDDYFYQYYSEISTIRPGHGYWVEKI